jgi:hypothetical protein
MEMIGCDRVTWVFILIVNSIVKVIAKVILRGGVARLASLGHDRNIFCQPASLNDVSAG